MLERILFKHLTKKGIIGYFVGTVLLFILWGYYVLGILDYSMDSGRNMFMFGALGLNIVWAGVCYLLWKKPDSDEQEKNKTTE